MATKFQFNNKTISEPGSYSAIRSGTKNPPLELSYGNVLILDTGVGANYGLGSGVNGTLFKAKDSIYKFDNIDDFRSAVGGGTLWALAGPLWQPKGFAIPGISTLYYVKAATTTPAEITYNFDDDSISINDQQSISGDTNIKIQVLNEGKVGNGVKLSGKLTRGYAGKMRKGTSNTALFAIDFYRGSFTGLDSDGDPWDGVAEADTKPELLVSSVEFNTAAALVAWMQTDATFNQYFKLKSYAISFNGIIKKDDLHTWAGYNLAQGGTETYSSTRLTEALDAVSDLDYTHVLSLEWGASAKSSNNAAILAHLQTEARYDKMLVIGGGKDRDTFNNGTNSSIDIATYYNDDDVVVVHAGYKKQKFNNSGFKIYDSIFKAAAILGRTAGLPPQVPVTFKSISMDADAHDMSAKERVLALDKGLLHTKFDSELNDFIVNEGVNTLQRNSFVINEDGTTHLWSLKRIIAQLNKEIVVNAKRQLLGQANGVNRNTLSAADVEQWLKGFLTLKTATDNTDNLILSFKNIVVTLVGDTYQVKYKFTPNSEITKIFFEGFVEI